MLFFLNDPATTEIYTLPLPDALPISAATRPAPPWGGPPSRHSQEAQAEHPPRHGDPDTAHATRHGAGERGRAGFRTPAASHTPLAAGENGRGDPRRSEEHTSELQSRQYLVCRLLLEKKKKTLTTFAFYH